MRRRRKTGGQKFLEAVEEIIKELPWQKCEREDCEEMAKFFKYCTKHLTEELES